jgi:dihydrofolate reductase
MSRVRVHNLSMSLDGFGTGEGQSLEAPFGHAGHRLMQWFSRGPTGAGGMVGRRTALPHSRLRPDPLPEAADRDERRDHLPLIDASPADALEAAGEAAGGLDVRIGGGPSTVREFLAADLIDHMHVVVVPIVLGRAERLWDGLESLEQRFDMEAVASPTGVTHLTFTHR